MSHSPTHGTPLDQEPFLARHSWKIGTVASVIMVALSLVGVGLTTTASPSTSRNYWVGLVPVFGFLCVLTAWMRSGPNHPVDRWAVARQVFHWMGIAAALWIDYLILRTGEETYVATGMNALLVLALGCYLAGVHLELLFVPVGLLLTLTLVLMGRIDQFQWLIYVVGAAALVVIFGLRWLLRGKRFPWSKSAIPSPSPPSGS